MLSAVCAPRQGRPANGLGVASTRYEPCTRPSGASPRHSRSDERSLELMPIFSRKPESPQALGAFVASGATYRVSTYSDAAMLSLQRQEWQRKAFRLYDSEGHLWYAANYVGSALSRIRLVAATRPKVEAEHAVPTVIEKGVFANAVANIRSPRGGQRGLLRQVGRNVFLCGEVWLVGAAETLANGQVEQTWDAVSIAELVTSGSSGKFQRRRLPGATPVNLPEGALTIRLWKEHPEYAELADSGTRPAMKLLEKIVTLNEAEKAIARSRLAGSGILALPQELVPPAWQNQGQNPNAMESNPLYQALAESMTAPLQDADHPSAVVPLVLIGPADVVGKIRYEEMSRSFDTSAANASIQTAIEQVANTLELPKEILLGTGDATHWTAWAIKEDTFQAHIQPLSELVCDALTRTYLKQALSSMSADQMKAALKEAGTDDPNDIIVWYDASQLVIQPDKADKALGLHDRFVISNAALRRENGYAETDAPDDDEYAKRVGLKVADPKMALTGKPPEQAPAPGGAPAEGAPAEGAGPGAPKGPRTVNGPRGQAPQGPKAEPPKTPAERRANVGMPQDSQTG